MDMDTDEHEQRATPGHDTHTLAHTLTLWFRQSQLLGYLRAAAGVFCFNKQFLICNYSSCSCIAQELFLMKVRMQTYYAYEACCIQTHSHTHTHRATSLLRPDVDCRPCHKTPIKVSRYTGRNSQLFGAIWKYWRQLYGIKIAEKEHFYLRYSGNT